ncbi:MAG: histidine--tRNA ligase, partial [Methanosarcinales archaeon]|nr:histidine--tRNA ligase [Methanosarcinales archaeon]
DVPSTGFGVGFDRIMEICEIQPPKENKVVIIATDDTRTDAIKVATKMRNELTVHMDIMKRNFKSQLSHANNIEVDYAVIVGKKELEMGKLTVKNMKSGDQLQLTLEEAIEFIKNN